PRLALLAEARRNAVSGADVLQDDGHLERRPGVARFAELEAEGASQEQLTTGPQSQGDALVVEPGRVDERIRQLRRERQVDARERVRCDGNALRRRGGDETTRVLAR